jgi:hypothetical protein
MSAAAWTPTEGELVHLLNATNASANRVRQVLIVMATASIIIFVGVWNTLEFSWMRYRAIAPTNVELWVAYRQDPAEKKRWDDLKDKAKSGKASTEEQDRLARWEKRVAAGEKLANGVEPPLAQIREAAKNARESIQESAGTLKIAFFGIVIDANDISLLGGLTFCVIMMWLTLSLWRQCSNLRMAFFQAAAADKLQFAYRYVAAEQVLHVPPPTHDGVVGVKPPHGAPSLLFWLPAFVQAAALVNDLCTFHVVSGEETVWHAAVQTLAAAVLLALIIILTLRCWYLRNQGRATWQEYYRRL